MALKILVIVFAVIIVVLFGVLFLYQPVKGPTVPQATVTSSMQ
jgi:hypothetical protein